jgi:hypothetical protein
LSKFPPLPDGFFWRVGHLLGSPILQIHKKRLIGSKILESIWIDEYDEEHMIDKAVFLKKKFDEMHEINNFLEKYTGDYPPKEL